MTSGDAPVSSLGESSLLARMMTTLPQPPEGEIWSGDDAALVSISGTPCLITTDAIVEGVDFELASASPEDVGWKAMSVNASDIAAMGGRPSHAVATLNLRPNTTVEVVDGVLAGLLEAANSYDIELVGGDVSEARDLAVTIALLGEVTGDGPVVRSGASPGDLICVTGELGGAAAGLMVLAGESQADRGQAAVAHCVRRQLRPIARTREGQILASSATAMIDLSDGLAIDLQRLLDASEVGCDIDSAAIPVDPSVAASGFDPQETAIVGGEDFELLFTIAPDSLEAVTDELTRIGTRVSRIGTIVTAGATISGRPLKDWIGKSWDHLRPR